MEGKGKGGGGGDIQNDNGDLLRVDSELGPVAHRRARGEPNEGRKRERAEEQCPEVEDDEKLRVREA